MQTPARRVSSRIVLAALGAVSFFLTGRAVFSRGIAPAAAVQVREGTVEVLFADNFEAGSSRILYDLLTSEGERISLRFDGAAPVSVKRGDRLRVTGRFVADTLAVERAERLRRARSAEAEAAASAWTIGPKRAIAILVNFLDDTAQPYTIPEAQNTMFGPQGSNVAEYWGEVSYGQTTITGDIAGWYTIPINKPTACGSSEYQSIQSRARAAATAGDWTL